MAVCVQHQHHQTESPRKSKHNRQVSVRIDILDASNMIDRHPHTHQENTAPMPVFVTVALVEWYKRLGDDEAIKKLKKAVNLGVMAMRVNGGDSKSNFVADPVPAEYLTVERYYAGEKTPGLIIDFVPLKNAEMLVGDW